MSSAARPASIQPAHFAAAACRWPWWGGARLPAVSMRWERLSGSAIINAIGQEQTECE
jgi:hypothetical protein